MKIICVGRNYADHIAELANERPDEPVIFTKPDTALLRNNEDFYYPAYTQDIHHEIELVVRICKEGKYIDAEFADRYYDQLALGIDFTARDLQNKAKAKGLPWAIAKGFNGSAPLSDFVSVTQFKDIQQLSFRLDVNGITKQTGHTRDMLWRVSELVAYISQFFTLKVGDLIFTGTPQGVGPVQIEDRLEGYLEGQKMLDFVVK
ncbi:MAG: fumarylacetoacetate hydrolase family protein [Bernardetiaceae bacterium]